MTVTFSGGIHPAYSKELAKASSIEELPPPEIAVVPVGQHIGAPAKPVVAKGDEVKVGQLIAEPGGFVSSPVHAPISGKVVAIEARHHPMGRRLEAIVIEADGEDAWAEPMAPLDMESADREALVARIRDAGVVGMGGATFPTQVKLSPPKGKKIDAVILNGAECEPYLTADHRVMVEDPEAVVDGLKIVCKVLGAERAIIGIEVNKPDAIEAIEKAARGKSIDVIGLEVKYPQGAEKQLIDATLSRQVPSGGLPMDVGVVVQNVGTAQAISIAVREGRPLLRRVTTVTGSIVKEPKNLLCRVGTAVSSAIEACGGLTGEPAKLILGGPMMGMTQYTDEVPIIKGTSGILLLAAGEVSQEPEGACIRCGECVRACPMGLRPTEIATLSALGRFEEAEHEDALDCIECGSCSWGCPARILLVQRIRHAKTQILAARRKNKG
jgi:Na+-translocating ferredoxin:NAD+ oxidoreductase subunit C